MKKFIATLAALMLVSGMALAALTLDAAKQQGLVGEQPDGLIGAVVSTPETAELVNTTNAERIERYKAIAEKNGTALNQVQAVAGQKLIDNTPPGQYVMTASGWQKK